MRFLAFLSPKRPKTQLELLDEHLAQNLANRKADRAAGQRRAARAAATRRREAIERDPLFNGGGKAA